MRNKIIVLGGFLLLAGIGVGIFFWPTSERKAIARVEELDGVYRAERSPDGRMIVSVIFMSRPIHDEDLAILKDIHPLHRVFLDGTKITDAGLAHLISIEGLQWVTVGFTAVTDEGMVHLSKIPELELVHLRKTQVSDAGLAHLQGLPKLAYVTVPQTKVTQAGVDALYRTTPSLKSVQLTLTGDD